MFLKRRPIAVLPGVTFGWSHTRSYSSAYSSGTFIQGERWRTNIFTDFLRVDASSNVELHMDRIKKAVFTKSGTEPDDTYTSEEEFLATLTHDNTNKVFVLKFTHTGETLTFYDFDNSYGAAQRGLLKERTDRYGNETIAYGYDSSTGGRIITATTTQGWRVDYDYLSSGTNSGKLSEIEVSRPDPSKETPTYPDDYFVLQRVKYIPTTSPPAAARSTQRTWAVTAT